MLFLGLLAISTYGFAQEATQTEEAPGTQKGNLKPYHDSIYRFKTKIPVPKRAGLYSALLPGLGQIYNKQYWKVGVVLGAAGAVTGFMIFNSGKYNTYEEAYLGRIDNDPTTTDTFSNYQTSDLDLLRKTYRKYTEYTVIAGTLCYLLNVLDAFTSAHLRTFDMNKNISFKAMPYYDGRRQVGIKIALALK